MDDYKCVKCRSVNVKFRYMNAANIGSPHLDWLECQCARCGYVWREDCADAQQTTERGK